MHRGILTLACLAVGLLHGQITRTVKPLNTPRGTVPRAAVAAYPARVQGDTFDIGAEYLAHTFKGAGQEFFTPHYLVVEVAFYPAPGAQVEFAASRFTLHLNGKRGIEPQPPGFVAADLKYPDWEERRGIEASVDTLDANGNRGPGVSIGRPQIEPRFPGDPRPGQSRIPPLPRAPDPRESAGIEHQPQASADEVAVDAALVEDPTKSPASGYIYFPYGGKLKSVRSIELHYQQGERSLVMRLM
ncbi:MAG: hypothetical protein HYX25_00535 [Candidatus Solibacter usitatus]|nr:hypothetical protein [Candidatus Solibacter usitatus]